jgi:DNA-binding NarL/FixJ family response regulator
MHDEELYGERALRAGARGYVTKNEPPGRIVQAVREVFAGRLAVSDALAQKLLSAMHSSNASTSSNIELLSDRELEVFQLLGQGVGTREIAERLNRGVKTIETYRTRIKEKLAVTSASELIVRAATWVAGRS